MELIQDCAFLNITGTLECPLLILYKYFAYSFTVHTHLSSNVVIKSLILM
jgi:hypothetical protein